MSGCWVLYTLKLAYLRLVPMVELKRYGTTLCTESLAHYLFPRLRPLEKDINTYLICMLELGSNMIWRIIELEEDQIQKGEKKGENSHTKRRKRKRKEICLTFGLLYIIRRPGFSTHQSLVQLFKVPLTCWTNDRMRTYCVKPIFSKTYYCFIKHPRPKHIIVS